MREWAGELKHRLDVFHLASRFPASLIRAGTPSCGSRPALADNPNLVIADEATGALIEARDMSFSEGFNRSQKMREGASQLQALAWGFRP